MTTRNKTGDSKSNDKGKNSAKSGPVDVQDGDMRSAILEIIQTDEDIMNSVIESVSQAIVTKFMNNPKLMDKLTKKVIEGGVLDRVKQELYESFKFDAETSAENLNDMGQRVEKLERANDALRDELDAQEQYSRRNCLLLHGVPETEADTTAAALHIIDQHLDIKLPSDAIDRSHRLGRTTGEGKPRPIIMKFVSYQDRRAVFGRKKNLKGTKIVLTENLTKRRAELLGKARAKAGVKATWTADGRIICLLEDGRKIAIDTARDLSDRIA